jgi:hypothetical protein
MTENETRTSNPKHDKLKRAYEHYREAGEIYDPLIANMAAQIAELTKQVEAFRAAALPTAPDTPVPAPRGSTAHVAAQIEADILSGLLDRLRDRCAYQGVIRECDIPQALDMIDAEINNVKAGIKIGEPFARQLEKIVFAINRKIVIVRDAILAKTLKLQEIALELKDDQ